MCGARVMIRSASATASANDWVSTGTPSTPRSPGQRRQEADDGFESE
jgi:hypothetical protein